MKSLFRKPCTIVAGVKEVGAAVFLAQLLEDAHPGVIVHVYAHHSAAQALQHLPGVTQVSDEGELTGESLLGTHRPDFVLVGASNGWSIEKSLINAARRKTVPVYAFIDNYMNTWQRFAHETTAQPWTYLPDRIYVIDNEMAEKMRSEGCPPNVITPIKHPVLEKIRMSAPSQPVSVYKADLGITEAEVVLTLAVEAGMPNSDLWRWNNLAEEVDPAIERLLVTLLDFALESLGRVVVLIKHHPTDKKSFDNILKHYPSSIYRNIFNTDKLALLDASTAVFGIGSMLLLEAAVRAKNTWCIDIQGLNGYPRFTSIQNLRILHSMDELKFTLNDLLPGAVRTDLGLAKF